MSANTVTLYKVSFLCKHWNCDNVTLQVFYHIFSVHAQKWPLTNVCSKFWDSYSITFKTWTFFSIGRQLFKVLIMTRFDQLSSHILYDLCERHNYLPCIWNSWSQFVYSNSQKIRHLGTIAQLCQTISSQLRHVLTIRKNLLNSNTSPTCPHVNYSPLTANIHSGVWGTPANFNGFRLLAALLHGTLVVGVSQTAAWTDGDTYIQQDGHHVGHWPTF